jgi:hypothetical protein
MSLSILYDSEIPTIIHEIAHIAPIARNGADQREACRYKQSD